jgi:uncharacterized protein (DUF1810 family)
MTRDDPFDLRRFVDAQARVYDVALDEIENGRKRSHWMWFVFPQLRGLGSSSTAQVYGIGSLAEARAYLAHPLLGLRLRECVEAALEHSGTPLIDIFGSPDDLKFRSSMTLFARAAEPRDPLFQAAIDHLCGGRRDTTTLELLDQQSR